MRLLLGNQFPYSHGVVWGDIFKSASLDLNFAKNKSLVDSKTGRNLVTFTRVSSGTYVGSDGLIKTATTDEARFDHDPTTGESLGLLVEESRTNLLTSSENVSAYNKYNVTTPFDSSVINPSGSTGSYKILANAGSTGVNSARINSNANSLSSIVVSAFVKKSTHRYVFIGFGGGTNSFTALFDIEPGLTSNRLLGQGGNGERTNIDAGYQNFPNDWIRIWAAGTTSGIEGLTLGMGPNATTFNLSSWAAAGTEEIYAWGLQYENNASFPTSYIPTIGSGVITPGYTSPAVTRAADVASITGANFSSWIDFNDGTFFSDSTVIAPSVQTQAVWSLTGGTYVTSLRQPQGAGNQFRAQIGNVFTPSPGTGDLLSDGTTKACVAYSGTAGRLQVGSSSDDATAVGVLDPTQFHVGSLGGTGAILNGTIRRLVYWPKRLSDPILQKVTR
jgi:hypothetical protein